MGANELYGCPAQGNSIQPIGGELPHERDVGTYHTGRAGALDAGKAELNNHFAPSAPSEGATGATSTTRCHATGDTSTTRCRVTPRVRADIAASSGPDSAATAIEVTEPKHATGGSGTYALKGLALSSSRLPGNSTRLSALDEPPPREPAKVPAAEFVSVGRRSHVVSCDRCGVPFAVAAPMQDTPKP